MPDGAPQTPRTGLVETQSLEGPHAPEEHAIGFPATAEGDTAVAAMEAVVSNVLRYGVLLSFAVVLLGSVWLFVSRHTGYADLGTAGRGALASLTNYRSGHAILTAPTSPTEAIRGMVAGKAYGIISLGLFILIATPVLRVAVSVFTFLWEGDRLYALITAYVLAVLVLSFVIGKGG